MDETYTAQVSTVKARHVGDLLNRRNVVACGVGYKVKEGIRTDAVSLVVSVKHKVHPSALSPEDVIPEQVDGIPTDVVELGIPRALQTPRDRWRPAPPGVSLGHYRISAGTLGCLVEHDDQVFILSNNHVLADVNQAGPGDPILQPGPADGGTMEDQIAALETYIPIDFGTDEPECQLAGTVATVLNRMAEWAGSQHRLEAVKQTPGVNRVDAALARPLSPDLVTAEILQIGAPTGVGVATLGTPVQKSGRTTGHTLGTITQVDATIRIDYEGRIALFENQLVASPMSQGGDSGSAVLDEASQVVGLLFAGSVQATIINPIDEVLAALDVEILVGA
ncbi:MAG: hypothetical protein PVI59_03780 [Anaerolineae bacterium]|jgi:hypothetical protein